MTTITDITITLDTDREPMLEISLNDGTGDIPHQFTRTADAYWIEEYINDAGYYTFHKYDTAHGALTGVCKRWNLNPDNYPAAVEAAGEIDGDIDAEEEYSDDGDTIEPGL